MKKIIVLAIFILVAGLSGCETQEEIKDSADFSQISATQREVEGEDDIKESISSEPEQSEQESSVIAIEQQSDAVQEEWGNPLPEPENGSDKFKADFMENPIDKRYVEEYQVAASIAKMIQINTSLSESWKSVIEALYEKAITLADDDDKIAIEQSQTQWNENYDSELQQIRDGNATGDSQGSLQASLEIMLFHRKRAAELAEIIYVISGFMPSFEGGVG